ncbi:hypothetical protein HU200_021102 [Digitaria exilis]|uniref:Uncharacterized protein n=1 Tax=Digitaria exilis TaxID=1010633 RepID=A0A835KDW5_9POAL|nr:hypothetical protein HU200_021102 [Digitaria exilis]CAB3472689.1 unnamed protein product [Digitaria exilis]
MAVVGKSSTPSTSLFKILKDGALLPARNQSLFMAVFALTIAYTLLRRLVNDLGVSTDELLRDYMAFSNRTDASPDEVHEFLRDVVKDTWRLFWPGARGAQRLLDITVGNAVWIVSLFAAVATYAGETCSFGTLLGKARAQLKGAALTIAFTWGLQVAYIVLLLSAMAALLIVDRLFKNVPTGPLLLGWLLLIAAAVFLKYFAFVCELGIVVAVAEPGRHSASAIGRAWRLLRGRRMRAVLFIAVTSTLAFVCNRAYGLARTRAVSCEASLMVLRFVYVVVMDAVELFVVCAITAFYYECKARNDAATATEFVKLASEELLSA